LRWLSSSHTREINIDQALVVLILPVIILIILLAWLALVLRGKTSFAFKVSALGVTMDINASKGGGAASQMHTTPEVVYGKTI